MAKLKGKPAVSKAAEKTTKRFEYASQYMHALKFLAVPNLCWQLTRSALLCVGSVLWPLNPVTSTKRRGPAPAR
jgi:hypothetical protein